MGRYSCRESGHVWAIGILRADGALITICANCGLRRDQLEDYERRLAEDRADYDRLRAALEASRRQGEEGGRT